MSDLNAAERYAHALLELARAQRLDREVEEALVAFTAALRATPAAMRFLMNPRFTAAERTAVAAKLFKGSPAEELLKAFFTTLFVKNRFELVFDVAEHFKRIADLLQNEATVVITSAVPLDEAAERAIVSRVEKIGGFTAEIRKKIDPSLVGGVVVRYRNRVIDGSVKGRLEGFRKELTSQRTV